MHVQQATMLAVGICIRQLASSTRIYIYIYIFDVISKKSVKSCHITNSSHGLLHARVLIACLLRCAVSPTCCLNTLLIVQISFRAIRDQFVIALVQSA